MNNIDPRLVSNAVAVLLVFAIAFALAYCAGFYRAETKIARRHRKELEAEEAKLPRVK